MSNKNKIFIFIILAILVVSVIVNIYFLISSKKVEKTPSNNTSNLLLDESLDENEINNNNTANNTISNNVSNTNTNTNTTNTVTKVNLSNETNDTSTQIISNNSEANIDEFKKLLIDYSVGIQRISYNDENLESNTILLFLAKQYFDSNSNKQSSLKIDTTYASTVENIHKYLTELTGKDYSNINHLDSYSNYIGYSSSNNAYIYGKDISNIKNEEYECPTLEFTKENDNGTYTAEGQIIRIVNNEETVYNVTVDFKINSNYKYQKYQIISLKSANKSFYPDNTVHLID